MPLPDDVKMFIQNMFGDGSTIKLPTPQEIIDVQKWGGAHAFAIEQRRFTVVIGKNAIFISLYDKTNNGERHKFTASEMRGVKSFRDNPYEPLCYSVTLDEDKGGGFDVQYTHYQSFDEYISYLSQRRISR